MVNIRPRTFAPVASAPAELPPTPSSGDLMWNGKEWVEPSDHQRRVFDFIVSGTGSAAIIAVAGSGKTSTIVEAARRLMSDPRIGALSASNRFSAAFVAFNKSIADELKARLPGSVRAQTLHSLGFGAWRRHVGIESANALRLDANKVRSLCRTEIPDKYYGLLSKGMPRLVSIAKGTGVVPMNLDDGELYSSLVEDSDDMWLDAVEQFGIDFEASIDNPDEAALIVEYARRILTKSIGLSEHLIDFDDQLYLPVIAGAKFWQNDILMVDEAQDLNAIQRVMIRRALKPNGRLIAVGDPNQAIYGFRGASSNSIDRIKKEFDCVELPLTISYRCPKAVVQEAHQWVSHIQSHESAAQGSVTRLNKYGAVDFKPTDVVVCRNTKPLIALAFNLLREGVACKVRGRDIGAGLVALVKRFKIADLKQFAAALDKYTAAKVNDYMVKQKDDLAQRLQDQFDTLIIFIDAIEAEGGSSTSQLIDKIEGLFTDNGPTVLTLATIHRFKGSEADRVFILDPDLMPSRFARTPEAKQQEANLQYVAVTRAKMDLIYVTSKGFKEGKKPKQE